MQDQDENSRSQAKKSAEERLADIEANIASSWALKTRSEYESEFKAHVKGDLFSFAVKLTLAAFIFLGGTGYLFLKSAIQDIYHSENERVVLDLRSKYDRIIQDQNRRFEWKKNHDYGKNYIYLAKFYANSGIADLSKKEALVHEQLERAKTYYEFAIADDPTVGQTYFEIGEIYNTYAWQFHDRQFLDVERAMFFYDEAESRYSAGDIAKGWRGDVLRCKGLLKVEQASRTKRAADVRKLLTDANKLLLTSREEYQNAIPEARGYHAEHLVQVNDALLRLSNDPRLTSAEDKAK